MIMPYKSPMFIYLLKLKHFKIGEWNKKSNKNYGVEIMIYF